MTAKSKPILVVLAVLLAFAGCGGGGHGVVPKAKPTPRSQLQNPGSSLYPDHEPEPSRFAQSFGPVPGSHGKNGALSKGTVWGIYGGHLARDAAGAWNTMNLAVWQGKRTRVLPGDDVDATYRTFSRQVYWRNYWCGQGSCGNAAVPGTSNHGWGRAVDLIDCSGNRSLLDRYGGPVGWRHGEVPYECWHVTYYGGFSRPNPESDVTAPRLCQGSGGYGQQAWVPVLVQRLRSHGQLATNRAAVTPKTARNLRNFQAAKRLKVTGCTDHSTWAALKRR